MLEQDPLTGEMREVETARQVFANRRSVRQSEFYAAHLDGLKPDVMSEVRWIEYQDGRERRYQGRRYDIIHTYDRGEVTELVCAAALNKRPRRGGGRMNLKKGVILEFDEVP